MNSRVRKLSGLAQLLCNGFAHFGSTPPTSVLRIMAGSVEEALALIRQRCANDAHLELAVISLESALLGEGADSSSQRRVGGWSYKLESLLQTLLCARLLRNSAT